MAPTCVEDGFAPCLKGRRYTGVAGSGVGAHGCWERGRMVETREAWTLPRPGARGHQGRGRGQELCGHDHIFLVLMVEMITQM